MDGTSCAGNGCAGCAVQQANQGNLTSQGRALVLARWAVYHMWRKGEAFDEERFWQGTARRAPVLTA
jgi:hypothetical protein